MIFEAALLQSNPVLTTSFLSFIMDALSELAKALPSKELLELKLESGTTC